MADSDATPADLDTDLLKAVQETDPAIPEPTEPPPQKDADAVTQSPAPAQTPAPTARKGGFVSGLFGGLIVGALTLSLALYSPRLLHLPDTAAIDQQLAAQTQATEALKAELARLAATPAPAPAPDPALQDRLAALEARLNATAAPDLAPLLARLSALETHLDDLEKMPTDGSAASPAAVAAQAEALNALKAEVAKLKADSTALTADIDTKAKEAAAQLDQARAAAAQMLAEAQEAGRVATGRAALGRIQAALELGAPFAPALADLGADAPVLAAVAETGVPSLTDLQLAYPAAAREALAASLRAEMEDAGWLDRIGNFFRSQTGVRSLTPKEGADADAVLSRAEAALKQGDLPGALTELAALPEPGKAAMAAWVAEAQQRIDAEAALAGLIATLGQN